MGAADGWRQEEEEEGEEAPSIARPRRRQRRLAAEGWRCPRRAQRPRRPGHLGEWRTRAQPHARSRTTGHTTGHGGVDPHARLLATPVRLRIDVQPRPRISPYLLAPAGASAAPSTWSAAVCSCACARVWTGGRDQPHPRIAGPQALALISHIHTCTQLDFVDARMRCAPLARTAAHDTPVRHSRGRTGVTEI